MIKAKKSIRASVSATWGNVSDHEKLGGNLSLDFWKKANRIL